MLAVATLLFGSLARSDHSESSDTDLLLISLNETTRHVSIGHLSMFLYPWPQLQKHAREGDLFVCHLAREAKPLLDPDDYLNRIKSTFEFRKDYQDDIDRATDFGMFLVRYGDELNSQLLQKRALWCVRTILIARSAERREPIFAPKQLAENTDSAAARELLFSRHKVRESTFVQQSLLNFLETDARPKSNLKTASRADFIERFTATSNKVALQTLRQSQLSQATYLASET